MTTTSGVRAAVGGAVLSAELAALALADQSYLGWTRRAVAAHYGPFGLHPDPAVLTTVLAVLFVGGGLAFALTAWLVRRGRQAGAVVVSGLGVVTGAGVASLLTCAHEYDGYVMITWWRLAPWGLVVATIAICAVLIASRPGAGGWSAEAGGSPLRG